MKANEATAIFNRRTSSDKLDIGALHKCRETFNEQDFETGLPYEAACETMCMLDSIIEALEARCPCLKGEAPAQKAIDE